MFEDRLDPQHLKSVFEKTEVLRKPFTGIISGYHVLPYILVGPESGGRERSIEVRGEIRVSPRLVISPNARKETYGDVFAETEYMDRALVGRIFSFLYSSRPQVQLENDELKIQKVNREPRSHLSHALDELMRREIVDTGVILSPDAKFYPVSLERYIYEILDEEFGAT
ncbi:MAG: hypothetical protein ACE5IM_02905 [Nitrospinota bacterium]